MPWAREQRRQWRPHVRHRPCEGFHLEGLPWAAQAVPVSQNSIPSHVCPNFQERTSYLQSSPCGSDAISRSEWSGNEMRVSPLIISPGSTEKGRTRAQWGRGSESLGCLSVCDKASDPWEGKEPRQPSDWGVGRWEPPLRRETPAFQLSFSHYCNFQFFCLLHSP